MAQVGEQTLRHWAKVLSSVARIGPDFKGNADERARLAEVLKVAKDISIVADDGGGLDEGVRNVELTLGQRDRFAQVLKVAADIGAVSHQSHDGFDPSVRIVEATADRVEVQLDVGPKVHQPFGILHGGVSAVLAESAASIGGAIAAAPGHTVVGIELNANHLRPMREGVLTALATPVIIGQLVHVWNIELTDEQGRMVCVSRCTLAVVEMPGE